jgi:DeoR/GlpR family transcriptional regulator of sugar metabolism
LTKNHVKEVKEKSQILNTDRLGEDEMAGGAYILVKQKLQTLEKQALAYYIVEEYIKNLDAVIVDAGSSQQVIIAEMMTKRKYLAILTNNMTAFRRNSRQGAKTYNEFILTGGKCRIV